jgi:hypothetical protein
MQSYSFSVALRFWHPSLDPAEITSALGIAPRHSAKAGQPRFTPKGAPLEGAYRESYWHTEWSEGWRESGELEAEDLVLTLLPRLVPHRALVQTIVSTGGRAMIQIRSFGAGNYALVLPSGLLEKCSNLQADAFGAA